MNSENQRVLTQLAQCVGRIEGKVDGIKEDIGELRTYTHETSKRVGALERARSASKSWIAGAMAVSGGLGAIAGIIVKVLF